MNVWLLLILFGAPVVVGAVMGVWSWWKPRHDLARLFAERRRVRVALPHIPTFITRGEDGDQLYHPRPDAAAARAAERWIDDEVRIANIDRLIRDVS